MDLICLNLPIRPIVFDENIPLIGGFLFDDDKPAILDIIKRRFPKVNFAKLGRIGFSKKGDEVKIVSFGTKGG